METQNTVLNIVTSEKRQEKIQKINLPQQQQQQQQQNLQRKQIQQYFLHECNTCQDQPSMNT